ncbi:MAG: ATP-dependent helicase [Candidatus Micrarchaeota archaeon]|nr:ATP-dependent helicase [Candidatus Micrarchaeota archaeon]
MISRYDKPFSREDSLSVLNVFIRRWFEGKYKDLTPPQRYSFKFIKDNRNLLITAPTGSGKTFSAFTAILSELMNLATIGRLEDKVYCIYVSPLRALNNDIYKNLSAPLDQIYSDITIPMERIRVGVRTGDTPAKDRQKMLLKPPHILVTTPESLAILVNSPKFLEHMKELRYFIVDEMHELANNKRGVHLSLSIERLEDLIGHGFVRIGLGATLSPLEDAAKFLVGYNDDGSERDCYIIDATWDKQMQYTTICPVKDIINAKDAVIENSIYKNIDKVIKGNKTTLVFTNTRSGTERVVYNLMKRYKYAEEHIAAHHGSLSRDARLGVEDMLKKGQLKCAVSSTSLELGIDIGTIDNVVQIGSPKSVARCVQRIGRSGHSFMDIATGEVIVTNRDDLVECSVMLDAAKKRHLDTFTTPKNALDVLCQHIVGMSQNKKWSADDAYRVVRRAYAYHNLERNDFLAVIQYLSGAYVGLESRRVYGKIWYEEKDGVFGRRGKLTKLIYFLNLGTIPDEVAIDVFDSGNKWIGSIQEEFLARLKPGDVFVLGGRPYKFEYSRLMNAYVQRADGQVPTIPPWYSEQLPLSFELAVEIGRFRERFGSAVERSIPRGKSIVKQLATGGLKPSDECKSILDAMPMDANSQNSVFHYFAEQLLFAKYIPNDRFLLIERTRDKEAERNMLIFHSLYGRRVNDALSRLIGIMIGDMYDIDVAINITDNGFVIMTDYENVVKPGAIRDVLNELAKADLYKLLRSNIRRTEMMKRRFRHSAARSFMILRNYKGKKISVRKQQVNSQLILKAAEEIDPNFPIIKETYREIFEDVMDLPRAKLILSRLASREIKYQIIETQVPSPFSHGMITFGEADIIFMKDRRKHIRELRKQVLAKLKTML